MKTLHSKILELLPSSIEEPIIEPDTLLVSYHDAEKSKKVTIKLGRLLTKKTSLSGKDIKSLVEFQRRNLKGELLMKLTQDADEIVSFYDLAVAPKGGTSSCMRGKTCVRVYAYDSNLFLATFYDGEEANEDTYVGRTLVRTDNMEYIRTYATAPHYHDNILLTLENAGYSEGSLVGIKLAKEKTCEGFVMPYLDMGGQFVEDHGNYFEVVYHSTSFHADTTNGIMVAGSCCGHCGNFVDEDEARYTEQEGDVCESCFEDHYITFEGEAYLISDCSEVIGGTYDGYYVPDDVLSEYEYYIPEDSSRYHHIDLLCSCSNGFYLFENCVELAEEDEHGYNYAPKEECTELEESETFRDYKAGWYVDSRYNEIMEDREENYVWTPDGWALRSASVELVEGFNGCSWAHEDVAYYYDKPTNHLEGWYYETRYNEIMEEFETQTNLFTCCNMAA